MTNARPSDENHGKPSIVLDLDETLVHVTQLRTAQSAFPIRIRRHRLFVQIRPHAVDVLKMLSQFYDLYIFTAATKEYSDQILNKAFPFIANNRRLYSDSCRPIAGYRVKDLAILGAPLEQIVMIDDIFGSAMLQPQNLFVVPAWMGDLEDGVFETIFPYLMEVAGACNVVDELRSAVSLKQCPFLRTELW
jgi:TFIIF-interacting CTD phosphatase-like protein